MSTSEAPRQLRPAGLEWVLCALVLIVFTPAWLAMAEVWSARDYYSHGYLIPFVALWLASAKRTDLDRVLALAEPRDGRGLALLLLALCAHLVATLLPDVTLGGVALVSAVAGLVWWLRGLAALRVLLPAVAYLLFMVPLPDALIAPLIVWLQGLASGAGVAVLQSAGYAVLRTGNVLEIPGGERLFVAEACSGITSLLTLLPLAVPVAYFSERLLGRRLLIVASVVPLALLGNLLRVVSSVIIAGRYGAEVATSGPLHTWSGVATYLFGCAALLAVARALRGVYALRTVQ